MDAKLNLKAKLPTRLVWGPDRASHHSFDAMAFTRDPIQLESTPHTSDLKLVGRYVAKDLFEGGGVPVLMRRLLDYGYLHGECSTVRGRTVAENLKRVSWNKDQSVVRPADKPLSATSGVVGLKGSLAPEGARVEVAGMAHLQFTGPARCFDGEEARFGAVKNEKYREGEVLVIRYRGPRGGPGMRGIFSTTAALHGARQLGPTRLVAVTHAGAAEKTCHAG